MLRRLQARSGGTPEQSKKRQGSSQRKPSRNPDPSPNQQLKRGGASGGYPYAQGSDDDGDQQEDVLYQSKSQYLQDDGFRPQPVGQHVHQGGGYDEDEGDEDDGEDSNPQGNGMQGVGNSYDEDDNDDDNAAVEDDYQEDDQAGGYTYDDDEDDDDPQYSD